MGLDRCKREQNLLSPSDLEAEIQRLQEEVIDERERHVRTLADFKNYRHRSVTETRLWKKARENYSFPY